MGAPLQASPVAEIQSGLAAHSVQIADIEARRKAGSIDTARRLAEALGVAIDDLV